MPIKQRFHSGILKEQNLNVVYLYLNYLILQQHE